jgi:hypothetical protein
MRHGLRIDRSEFYKVGSPEILQLFDGVERIINRVDFEKVSKDIHGQDGLTSLYQMVKTINDESKNPLDNVFEAKSTQVFYINIYHFLCGTAFNRATLYTYDIRDPKQQMVRPNVDRRVTQPAVLDWKNIPYRSIRR